MTGCDRRAGKRQVTQDLGDHRGTERIWVLDGVLVR